MPPHDLPLAHVEEVHSQWLDLVDEPAICEVKAVAVVGGGWWLVWVVVWVVVVVVVVGGWW
jgi:hypothetical protein